MAKMKPQKPHPQHWSDATTAHRGISLSLTVNTENDSVTVDVDVRNNFPLLDDILSHSGELQELTGIKPTASHGEKDGRVRIERTGCSLRWRDYIAWQLEKALKLKGFLDQNW